MVAAWRNSSNLALIHPCNCYRVSILVETILNMEQIACGEDRYFLGVELGWGGLVLFVRRSVTLDDLRSVKFEIEIVTGLSGRPNVVNLKAVYEDEDYVHLVMELCAGGELFQQLEKHVKFLEFNARVLFRHFMQLVLYCHDKETSGYWRYNQAADVWSAGFILYIFLCGMTPFWGKIRSRIFDAVRAADLRFLSEHQDHIFTSMENEYCERQNLSSVDVGMEINILALDLSHNQGILLLHSLACWDHVICQGFDYSNALY
ncbi:hypothetical protein MKW94_025547 [Papaver nudicaule]|uniref:Protein kinase domain-containing protein n=1 Tax=Papaver nudicaule TaxID=74823 RepID=A0AA41SKJ5_PAPNU|nr:hypothetical protein [Papaver nudicaule]